jgi:hypothetical protein
LGQGVDIIKTEEERRQRKTGGKCEIRGLRREFKQLLSMFDPAEFEDPRDRVSKPPGLPDQVGRAAQGLGLRRNSERCGSMKKSTP